MGGIIIGPGGNFPCGGSRGRSRMNLSEEPGRTDRVRRARERLLGASVTSRQAATVRIAGSMTGGRRVLMVTGWSAAARAP